MSNTAQRIPSSYSGGWDRNQEAALSAVLPGTMSFNWRPPTSTTEVHHILVRQRPCPLEQGLVHSHSLGFPHP